MPSARRFMQAPIGKRVDLPSRFRSLLKRLGMLTGPNAYYHIAIFWHPFCVTTDRQTVVGWLVNL